MTIIHWTIAILLAVLILIIPLAHATPADQTWLGGWWDDADFDDVILLLTESVAATDHAPMPNARAAAADERAADRAHDEIPTRLHGVHSERGPPGLGEAA